MKNRRVWLIGGICLMVIGLLFSMPAFLRYQQALGTPKVAASPFTQKSEQPAPASNQDGSVVYQEGKPVRIQIPSLGINLPVADGRFNAATKKWTLSNDKAHYAVKTPLPNNAAGNTFVYGHNRPGVFKKLAQIKLGEEAIITVEDGREFVYVFKGAYETDPNDDSVFNYQGPPMLTVQTCSGLWYQNRQLFTFDLKEIQE
jgi:LPXTG-site transpeptidase (sortase) family protein